MDTCPLAKVPADLRALILEYALCHPCPLEISPFSDQITKRIKSPTALSRTCRQIHHESSHLLYTLNIFLLRPAQTTLNHGSASLLSTFTNQIGRRNTASLRHVILEIEGSAVYFGQDIRHLRSIIKSIAQLNVLQDRCTVVVRPLFLADRQQYPNEEFESFLENVQLDVRDVERSLRWAIERVQEKMKTEECQGKWRDLFWAKRLYGDYLEQENREDAELDGKKVADAIWTERIFEDGLMGEAA